MCMENLCFHWTGTIAAYAGTKKLRTASWGNPETEKGAGVCSRHLFIQALLYDFEIANFDFVGALTLFVYFADQLYFGLRRYFIVAKNLVFYLYDHST